MKTVREVIRRAPVWVNPEHTAESAIVLMRGLDIGALPVLDGGRFVGILPYNRLLGVDLNRRVGDVMAPDGPTVSPDISVREASQVISRSDTGRLPVLENGRLVGVITRADLLPELGRSFDPLTELPWSDSLREWAIDQLKRGCEITVLFIDLDQFGQFNKLYGHIVGDQVLQSMAQMLTTVTSPDTDFLCRYGGDEFCIATLRPADEATDLAARINRRTTEIDIPTLNGQRISCTIGQFGGKRTKEREHTHYAATLNSLINLASRDSMERKKEHTSRQPEPPTQAVVATPRPEHLTRLRLTRIDVSWAGRTARVRVDLEVGSERVGERIQQGPLLLDGITRYSATSCWDTDENGLLRLIAETTASAMRNALPEGYDIIIKDVLSNRTVDGQELITVVGQFETANSHIPIAGSAVVADDRNRTAASAVLAAANRQIGAILARA